MRHRRDRPRWRWLPRWRRFRLIRVFRKDPLFAWVFGVLGVLGSVGLLAVPRIWRTTPRDFPGSTVWVNAIDLVQARSLARSARHASLTGDFPTALAAWQGAIANNLGDPRWHRGLLELLVTTPKPHPDLLVFAQGSIRWLLALTETNRSDLTLCARVLERYGRPAIALSLLTEVPASTPPDASLAPVIAQCAIASHRLDVLDTDWTPASGDWESDPILRLYAAAWREAKTRHAATPRGRDQLRASLDDPGIAGETAARLLVGLASRRGWLDDLSLSLDRLEQCGAASAIHHAELWSALFAADRAHEARTRALAYTVIPRDSETAAILIRALRQLGLTALAIERFDGRMAPYGSAVRVWREFFECLALENQWEGLRRAIAEARAATHRQGPLFAETLYAAYRLARASGLDGEAARLATELAGADALEPASAVSVAQRLRADGHANAAASVLDGVRSALSDDPSFWTETFALARARGDLEGLRAAVDALSRLDSSGRRWQNARAALLLILDEDRAEALRLTFEAFSRNPDAIPLRINHAFALTRNERAPEADDLLRSVPPESLTPEAAANFHLAKIEVADALERWTDVVESARHVDRSTLLPPQITRLDQMLRRAQGHIDSREFQGIPSHPLPPDGEPGARR